MNNTTFTKNVVEPTINQIQIVLGKKAFEYTPENDRFHNFRQAGLMQNITPEQALWGMNAKHIISIQDIVNDTAKGSTPNKVLTNKGLIDEKINDAINYLMLLKGLLYERVDKLNELRDKQIGKEEKSESIVESYTELVLGEGLSANTIVSTRKD